MEKNFDSFERLCNSRGVIKEWMGLRRIRTINIHNYLNWKGFIPTTFPVRTVKLDILNGYLYLYDVNNEKIDSETAFGLYEDVYDMIKEIFSNESLIPYKKRRNIIVKVNR